LPRQSYDLQGGVIKNPEGEKFLDRWIKQLKADAVRHRKVKSEFGYFDQKKIETNEGLENVA